MANQIYESSYIVNSFNAINASTLQTIAADSAGYITVSAGTKIIFKDFYSKGYTSVNTIVFFTKDKPMKVQINDNTMYPLYVPANDTKGLQYIRVDSITALSDCTFYYEGMAS